MALPRNDFLSSAQIVASTYAPTKKKMSGEEKAAAEATTKEVMDALLVLAENTHIEVDTGLGRLEASTFGLLGTLEIAMTQILPRIEIYANRWNNDKKKYTYADGKKVSDEVPACVQVRLEDNIDRYGDFPDIVKALRVVKKATTQRKSTIKKVKTALSAEQLYFEKMTIKSAISIRNDVERVQMRKGNVPRDLSKR